MAFHRWGFIYLGMGQEDPTRDRAVIEHGGLTTTIVAVPDPESAARVAVELVEDGAQSIELCGGFGPSVVADVVAAVQGRIPVGGVTYGMESVPALARLFSDEH